MAPIELQFPLPARKSAHALRDQLIRHLLHCSPKVGDPFLSDHQLARLSGLSRPTVRRALDDLQRDGWIERRQGRGTFVGPRAAMPVGLSAASDVDGRRMVHLGVLIHLVGDLGHDWYSRGVIEGLDDACDEHGIAMQMLGDRDGDIQRISKRLMQHRPDVLACFSPSLQRSWIVGEARRLGVAVIGTGSLMATLELPAVQEDGVGGIRMAVEHLVAKGHRRIGLVQPTYVTPFIFQRREGFMQGLEQAGLEPDEGMVQWVDHLGGESDQRQLMNFIRKRTPTALIFSAYAAVRTLAGLVRRGDLKIPRDISTVSFDQHPEVAQWLGGVEPTLIEMPLRPMGRKLAELARRIVDERSKPAPVQDVLLNQTADGQPRNANVTIVPCTLREGQSVLSM